MKNSAARKLRQAPAGYLAMGVDSHKKKHAVVAITEISPLEVSPSLTIPERVFGKCWNGPKYRKSLKHSLQHPTPSSDSFG